MSKTPYIKGSMGDSRKEQESHGSFQTLMLSPLSTTKLKPFLVSHGQRGCYTIHGMLLKTIHILKG